MLRRSYSRLGFFSILSEELSKLPNYITFRAKTQAKASVDSAAKAVDFLAGANPNEDAATREKRERHKNMYDRIVQERARREMEEKQKADEAIQHLPWKERIMMKMRRQRAALQQATSKEAAVMALLQHCTASHAAEIALEQGVDVKDVKMVLEKRTNPATLEQEEVVVGYIDAPQVSEEEVMAFAEKLHKACPVANRMSVDWRHGTAEDANSTATTTTTSSSSSSSSSLHASGSSSSSQEIPTGMPGSWRSKSAGGGAPTRSSARVDEDDDALHLPGVRRKPRHDDDNTPR